MAGAPERGDHERDHRAARIETAPRRPALAGLCGAHFAFLIQQITLLKEWLATRSSPKGAKCGGAMGIRTPDPLLAKQMLYQLSYGPTNMKNDEVNERPLNR